MQYINLILAAAYPESFRTNQVFKDLGEKIIRRVSADRTARSYNIRTEIGLIEKIEYNTKLEERYDLLYPYFKWLYTKYSQGKLGTVEDVIEKILPALYSFHRLKVGNRLQAIERDLGKVKNGKALLDLVHKYAGQELSRREIGERMIKEGLAERFYDDADVQVIIPRSKKASRYFGVNTQWCTSARGKECEFKHYGKRGTLYYVLFKKQNERFAIYIGKPKKELRDNPSAGEMDIFNQLDDQVNPQDLVREYPIIGRIFKDRFEFNKPDKKDVAAIMRILAARPQYIREISNPTLEMKKQALSYSENGYIYRNMEKGDKELHEFILGSKGLDWAKSYVIQHEYNGKVPTRWRKPLLQENTEYIRAFKGVSVEDWMTAIDKDVAAIRWRDGDYKIPPKKVLLYAIEKAKTLKHVDAIIYTKRKIPEKYKWKFLRMNPGIIGRMRKPTLDMWRFAISWDPKIYRLLERYGAHKDKISKEFLKELKQLSKATKQYRKEQLKKSRTFHVRPKQQPHMLNWAQLQKAVKSD